MLQIFFGKKKTKEEKQAERIAKREQKRLKKEAKKKRSEYKRYLVDLELSREGLRDTPLVSDYGFDIEALKRNISVNKPYNAPNADTSTLDEVEEEKFEPKEEKETVFKPRDQWQQPQQQHAEPNLDLKGLPRVAKVSNKTEKGVDIQLQRAMKKIGVDIKIGKVVAGYSADYYNFTIDDMKHKKIYSTDANRELVLDILRQELDPIEDKGVKTSRNVNFGAKATPEGFLFRVQKKEQKIMYGEHYYHMLRRGSLDAVFECNGVPTVLDLYQGVHIMIAGTTGSGKSVALNSIIKGWQSANTNDTLSLTMVNPKIDTSGGDLFSEFRGSPFLREPIITQVGKSMEAFLLEIDALLDRQIELMKSIEKDYAENNIAPVKYHVLAFDEVKAIFALDKSNSEEANELNNLRKSIMYKVNTITAEGRSSRVLMLMATQSPTAEVLGGVKANLTIMSLKVANDSQASVCGFPKKGNDVSAKELNGRGDGLLPLNSHTYRIQSPK